MVSVKASGMSMYSNLSKIQNRQTDIKNNFGKVNQDKRLARLSYHLKLVTEYWAKFLIQSVCGFKYEIRRIVLTKTFKKIKNKETKMFFLTQKINT
mgnify:CR=1 FL=1